MYIINVFFNGTCIQYPFENIENFNKMKSCGDEMIVSGLKTGNNILELSQLYKNQLEEMEKRLYDKFGENEYNYNQLCKVLNYNERRIWFLNVSALLKLKVINDDDMNGFVIVKQ